MITFSIRLTICLSLIVGLKYTRSDEDLPSWLTNETVQSHISAIFSGIDHVDIILGDLTPNQSYPPILDWLIHRRSPPAILHGKTIRIYQNMVPGLKETGCKAGRPILSAIVDTDDANEDELGMIDRDYGDESRFIVLDRTFESFARVWDQNHQYGYLTFASWTTFQLSMTCLLDPYATYLLILSDGLDLGELTKFSKATWITQGVFRVFFMLEERIYTFDPFMAIGPREYGVLKELGNISDIPRIPQGDFKGYPLRIDRFRTTFSHTLLNKEGKVIDFIGADAEASRVVIRALNLTPNFLPPDKDQFGFKLPNGSFNGVLGRLSRRESDIVFVGYFIKDYFTRDTEFTAGIYVDELCCLVRKASRIPQYLLPITIFPADLWGLLFLMGIVCATTWIIIRTGIKMKAVKNERRAPKTPLAYLFNLSNTIRDAPLYRNLIQIVVDTYILLMSAPYRRFTRSGIERLMLFGLMLVSLIFVSMFQSSLSSVFLHPMFYKDIDSLQRLDESGIKIPVKYKGFMDDVFPANYSSMMDSLRNKMIYEPEQDEAAMLDRVAQSPKIAFVTRKSLVPLDDAIYIAKKQVIVVPECPRLYNLAYVVPRHSVLLEAINVVILRLLNGGLIEQWINVMNYNATMRDLALYRNVDDEKFKILTMNDLQFPFYLWAIGLILSSVIFIIERMYYRLVVSNRIEMF